MPTNLKSRIGADLAAFTLDMWPPVFCNAGQVLTEIGPRFVLDPIRILGGSFSGQTLCALEESQCINMKRRYTYN